MPELLEERRENWGSRAGFVLAAIGSAVGLGNLWGFPYKVYDHGGGAFLIPYVFAMIAIGVPLMILEFSIGHMTQRAAPDAYRGISRRTEPVGWWGIILGFIIITYYPVILAYCGSYLVECVKGIFQNGGELAWKGEGIGGVAAHFSEYLHEWKPEELAGGTKPWSLGGLVSPIVISLLVIWGLMYLCICRGVRLVSKVVLITVPLPWIMLLILTVRGLTLPGAARGLNFYLSPDWSQLAEPETWRWAFGQMFFSMSLAFGVMVTYASFLHRKSDLNNNAAIIVLADVGTSFIAGIAVFAALGAMAFATEQAGDPKLVTEVVKEGPGLAFVAFPYALAQLPGSAWFGAVFFIALLTLGIDSAFSITESVLASLVDKTRWSRGWLLVFISLAGLGLGLVYCTRGGLSWLGAVDGFINAPHGGIVLLGLLEAAIVGWAYRIKRLREHANERSDWKLGCWWDLIIRYLAPFILSGLFTWSILKVAAEPGGFLWARGADGGWVFQTPALVSLIIAIAAPVLAVLLSCIRSPGANAHAQHVGQKRAGRTLGVVGILCVLAAAAVLACSFAQSVQARWATEKWAPGETHDIAAAVGMLTVAGREIPKAAAVALGGAALALVGVILGAGVVAYCERRQRRPSGFARLSAGAGVMTFGGAGGLVLGMFVLLHKLAALPGASTQPAAKPKELDQLAAPSWITLGAMTAILVVGLGWCFYRAIKAGGAGAEEQVAEDA